jgi:hypothetical protein
MGVANPIFTGSITGFVNNDTMTNATTGTLAFNSPALQTSVQGTYAIDGTGLSATNYIFVQAPGNATALTVNGLPQPVQNSQSSATSTPTVSSNANTSNNSGAGSGGPTINLGSSGNGAVTANWNLAGSNGNTDASDYGDLTPQKQGISIPVFIKNSSGLSPQGLYDVSYNQSSLTVLPSGQNVPPPPVVTSDAGPAAVFDMKVGDTTSSFSVQALNGVIRITPRDDAAKQVIQTGDKTINKLVLANGILSAINELSVIPDQVLAVFIMDNP